MKLLLTSLQLRVAMGELDQNHYEATYAPHLPSDKLTRITLLSDKVPTRERNISCNEFNFSKLAQKLEVVDNPYAGIVCFWH